MMVWFRLLRARTLLLFYAMLVPVALLPVLYFLALVAWQMSTRLKTGAWLQLPATLVFSDYALKADKVAEVLPYIPHFASPWSADEVVVTILDKLHVGLIPALLGSIIILLGVLGVWQQRERIRLVRQWRQDRLRRTRDYRHDTGRKLETDDRREPFIGSSEVIRRTDRRVA